jgi:gamma-glutamyltranspeptidase/glutathione hydrolase
MLKEDPAAKDGVRAPRVGEIMKIPRLAETFIQLGTHGKAGFYSGRVAEAIDQVMKDLGGNLTKDDLEYHASKGSKAVDPMSLRFTPKNDTDQSVDVWEHPPNGQGIIALMALGIIQELEGSGKISQIPQHNSAEYLHLLIETLRIAFADGAWWISDPEHNAMPDLLSRSYLADRATLFNPDSASDILNHGSPALRSSDTVYFAVTDSSGNAISVVNSNYHGFGTGVIPRNCGFTLQSRGANFSLVSGHPNALAPRKRPYHTIIPAMATNAADGTLHSVFGVMGGFMQPQGHVQVLLNMLVFGMSPQEALDAPRVCIGGGIPEDDGTVDLTVHLEEGISADVVEQLEKKGHRVQLRTGWQRDMFGRGQIILSVVDEGQRIYSAGSDPRGDGMALPL